MDWLEQFPDVSYDDGVARVGRDDLLAFVAAARADGFTTFIDLCAVDHLRERPRFEVVTNLIDRAGQRRLRIHTRVPGDDPTLPSISGIFVGANFFEREAWDLMGIHFEAHPDLTRILMPDDWEGHPLRKDYSVGSVPVQFKGAHLAT